ncbi:uncharacterized protein LOC128552607 [Mercenaria mercenaria]|uniref:uncharacterized protein LOC128552607 n=1 Tax=Mercenaria mercenaria TaxID=6596 RepID=UPI00234F49C4|nr:uncharacterized protein LOC128552607 [Mercenaria mercenaria]
MTASCGARRFPSTPPPDYKFNNLIVDLSKNITSLELVELKERFKEIIPHDVRTPRAMFDALRTAGYVDGHNILYIQQILRALGREDLLEIAAKYIKLFEEDEILHFFQKTTHLAEGCSIVEFHVVGHNLSNRRDLEAFRKEVSTILLVPIHEVIVKGVQETSSTLITLMLPEIFVLFLKHQLDKNKQYMIESLIRQGVDEVLFSTHDFKLKREGTYFLAEKTQRPYVQNGVGQSHQSISKRLASKPRSQQAVKKKRIYKKGWDASKDTL